MDKGLAIVIVVGLGALYFITNFTKEMQNKGSTYSQNETYKKYISIDSVGQSILDVSDENEALQMSVWDNSELKDEFLELFPDFVEMKNFIDDRIRGEKFKNKLIQEMNAIENEFASGHIGVEEAKRKFRTLK